MKKTGMTIICVLIFLISSFMQAGALENANGSMDNLSENSDLDPSYKRVDFEIKDITVYPEDVILVTKEATIGSGEKFFTEVEGSVYPGAIRVIEKDSYVKDITVRYSGGVRNRFSMIPVAPNLNSWSLQTLLKDNYGKKVEIITDDGIYEGEILLTLNGYVFLSDVYFQKIFADKIVSKNASFICLKSNNIQNIVLFEEPELPEENEEEEPVVEPVDNSPKTRICWSDSGGSQRKVILLYLASGVSWSSEYFLDTYAFSSDGEKQDPNLEHWARIKKNLGYDLTDVNVKLVAGKIKLDTHSNYGNNYAWATHAQMMMPEAVGYSGSGSSSSRPATPTSFSMEEYEVYVLPSKISLKTGETKLIQIKNDDVEIEIDYVYDATHLLPQRNYYRTWEKEEKGKVQKIFKIKNNDKTWPNGKVNVYQDYMLIGQDTISWTPRGREAKVTIGVSSDIEVKKQVTVKKINPEDRYNDDFNYTITLNLHNYKDEEVTVRIFDNFNSRALDLSSDTSFEEQPGNKMEWMVTLEPGEEKDITYKYKILDD